MRLMHDAESEPTFRPSDDPWLSLPVARLELTVAVLNHRLLHDRRRDARRLLRHAGCLLSPTLRLCRGA